MTQFHIILQLENQIIDYQLDANGKVLNHKFPRQKKRSHAELVPIAQLLKNYQPTFVPSTRVDSPPLTKVHSTPSTKVDSTPSTEVDSPTPSIGYTDFPQFPCYDWLDFESLPWEIETNSFFSSPFDLFPIED